MLGNQGLADCVCLTRSSELCLDPLASPWTPPGVSGHTGGSSGSDGNTGSDYLLLFPPSVRQQLLMLLFSFSFFFASYLVCLFYFILNVFKPNQSQSEQILIYDGGLCACVGVDQESDDTLWCLVGQPIEGRGEERKERRGEATGEERRERSRKRREEERKQGRRVDRRREERRQEERRGKRGGGQRLRILLLNVNPLLRAFPLVSRFERVCVCSLAFRKAKVDDLLWISNCNTCIINTHTYTQANTCTHIRILQLMGSQRLMNIYRKCLGL